ncbi:MAG TPA: FHA domain-containing protein, partial [Polyangiaceae bacterium]|nr:FHA domain-containing protein [Polyangiaceae bacterium]
PYPPQAPPGAAPNYSPPQPAPFNPQPEPGPYAPQPVPGMPPYSPPQPMDLGGYPSPGAALPADPYGVTGTPPNHGPGHGSPPALADMRIAGSEAFEATAFSPGGPAPLPPTGAMSPFPSPVEAPAMAPPGVAGPSAGMYSPPPHPAEPSAGVQGLDPMAETNKAGVGRILRGFLYSFHTKTEGEFWPLFAGQNSIGRADAGEDLDIFIADPTTSSRHATIISEVPGRFVLQDAGSTNGTFVNDQPVGFQGSVEIHDGDRIRLGGYNAAVRFITR